jgi:hypothetical protein
MLFAMNLSELDGPIVIDRQTVTRTLSVSGDTITNVTGGWCPSAILHWSGHLRHQYLQKHKVVPNHFALLPNQPVMEANAMDATTRSAQEAWTHVGIKLQNMCKRSMLHQLQVTRNIRHFGVLVISSLSWTPANRILWNQQTTIRCSHYPSLYWITSKVLACTYCLVEEQCCVCRCVPRIMHLRFTYYR